VYGSWGELRKAKLGQDGIEIFGNFGSGDGRDKFCLCQTGSCDGLSLQAVSNWTAREQKTVAGGGAMMTKIVAMCSVNKANKLMMVLGDGKVGQGSIVGQDTQGCIRQSVIWSGSPIDEAPVDSVVKVLHKVLHTSVAVETSGRGGKFGKGSDGIANVRSSGDIGK
jgi:hypothetical protein